jgi:hypothetical protein
MAGMNGVDRRTILWGGFAAGALLALAGCASVPNAPAEESALARETVSLSGSAGAGQVQAVVWTPQNPRGIVLLAGDGNAPPDRYQPLVERLGAMSLVVIAPQSAGGGSASAESGTREGVAELGAAALFAKDRFAGMPILAIGHGSGSLTAMALGKALAEEGSFTEPTPRGVIAFSAPSGTERLAGADAASGLGVPLLLLAGGNDPVPAERLLGAGPIDADAYALVLAGGGGDMVHDAAFVERAWPVVDLFVQAYLFDIFTAGDVLEKWPATGQDRFIARRGSQ